MKGLYPTTKQFPGTVSLKLLVKKNILSLKFAHERRNLLAIAARFRFSYHVGVAIRINRPPESQVPTAAQLHRQKNKLERSPVPSQCQPLVKGRGRCLSNERGWVASASTGSKPASQPAATATGQLLAGGGDVHGGERMAVPKKPISQVAGPTRHIYPPTNRGIVLT
jgi:hypothetical protein